MQIQLKVQSLSADESGGKKWGSDSRGQFCRRLPRKRNSACTGKSREGCPGTSDAAQRGKSGYKGCKEGYGESLEKHRRRRLEEEVRESC